MCDIEHLHTFTDAEDRFLRFEYFSHRREQVAIVFWNDTSGAISRVTIEARVDVGSSRKYIGVAHIEIALEIHRKCGDDDRDAS